jgi:heptosyltransferase-2
MKIAVRVPNWIGDAVLALPALHALKANHPQAEVWVVAEDWVKDLFLSGTPAEGVISLSADRSLKGLKASARRLKQEDFEAGLLLTHSFGSALVFALAGIPQRWGYSRDGRRFLLTRRVPHHPEEKAVHQAESYLRLIRGLGMKTPPAAIRLTLSPKEKKEGRARLDSLGLKASQNKPLVVLNPGASYGPAKRWPAERFARLAALLQRQTDALILVTGSAQEAELAERLASAMPRPPVVLSGKTTLRQFMGILSHARLFITNDSGPMHMANALAVPVVGLFGPTDPAVTRPFQPPSTVIWKGAACWPCLYRSCPYGHECMTAIQPENVLEAALPYLR